MTTDRPIDHHRFDAVVFDFDYTLADSSEGAVTCVNYALDQMGLPTRSPAEIQQVIGMTLETIYHRFTGDPEAVSAARFKDLFVHCADEVVVDHTYVYPYVPGTVWALKGMGLKLAILSTKYRHRIESVLKRERLHEAFDAIVGGEDVCAFKPHPEGLHNLCRRLVTPPSRTLMVGDTVIDAEAAQRAGMDFVGVLSGVTTAESFAAFPALEVIESVAHLPVLLQVLPKSSTPC